MIIVYAAVAGQSVVKLYAAAMFPGFFLAFLYLVYIVAWALINPKIAPPLPAEQNKIPVPAWMPKFQQAYSHNMLVGLLKALASPGKARQIDAGDGRPVSYWMLITNLTYALVPFAIVAGTMATIWWYVVIHQQRGVEEVVTGVQQLGSQITAPTTPAEPGAAGELLLLVCGHLRCPGVVAAALLWEAERRTTAGRKARDVLDNAARASDRGRAGRHPVRHHHGNRIRRVGAAGAFLLAVQARTLDWKRTKEAVFLTAKTTAMVCWLFVGSALFSGVFAILGGQALVEHWVLSLNMTPIQFMILSQAIIFVLGWPLEWTEIIVIFVPIFLPLLKHFNIDPVLWGVLVFVNLQAAFLSPPVAMSAFYLKGVAPKHVTLNQIFAGMMPYMLIVILCMVIMYLWPGMTLWLPAYLYAASVMIEKFAGVRDMVRSEFLDLNHTSKLMILVSLMIPKFARDAGGKGRRTSELGH